MKNKVIGNTTTTTPATPTPATGRNVGTYFSHAVASFVDANRNTSRHTFVDVDEKALKKTATVKPAETIKDTARKDAKRRAENSNVAYCAVSRRERAIIDATASAYSARLNDGDKTGTTVERDVYGDGVGRLIWDGVGTYDTPTATANDILLASLLDKTPVYTTPAELKNMEYTPVTAHSVADMVARGAHIGYARHVVKRMAGAGMVQTSAPCYDMVASGARAFTFDYVDDNGDTARRTEYGYNQPIFEDVAGEIALTLACLENPRFSGVFDKTGAPVMNDADGVPLLTFTADGRPVFGTYETTDKKTGDTVERPAFLLLYRALNRALSAYSDRHNVAGRGVVLMSYDAIIVDDDGRERGINATTSRGTFSAGYMDAVQASCIELEDIENRADVRAFFRYVGMKHPQGYNNAVKVFCHYVAGYNTVEIAEKIGVSRPAVSRTLSNIRSWYAEYKAQ